MKGVGLYQAGYYAQVAMTTASVGWVSLNDATAHKRPVVISAEGMARLTGISLFVLIG